MRGAFHALTRLMAEEGWEEGGGRERGVVTHSSGRFLYIFEVVVGRIEMVLVEWLPYLLGGQEIMLKLSPLLPAQWASQPTSSCRQSLRPPK